MIKIDKDECAVCKDCIDVCPEEAIRQNVYSIVIDNEKCNLCEECVDVCSVGAIYNDENE